MTINTPEGAIPDATGWHKEMTMQEFANFLSTLEGEEW